MNDFYLAKYKRLIIDWFYLCVGFVTLKMSFNVFFIIIRYSRLSLVFYNSTRAYYGFIFLTFKYKFFELDFSLINEEYLILLYFLFVSVLISLIILLTSYLLNLQKPEAEKLSAYECGFEPYEDTRHTFDVRFCVIAILFMIFDLEIMFLMPWVNSLANLNMFGFWAMIEFLFELVVGLGYALYIKAFDLV